MEEYMEVALVSAGYIMVATTSFVGMGELQKRGHVASAVECYMKQHTVTKEVAFVEFNKRISNAWKDMNQESFHPTAVPMALLERVLNLACIINILYKDEDGYTHAKTQVKNAVVALLIKSVPI
ncbi:hypothetical protein LguiB_028253 [Lonicera macranthoides]